MKRISKLRDSSKSGSVGAFAESLLVLDKKGFVIPETYIITGTALKEFDQLASELSQITKPEDGFFIHRSSEEIDRDDFRASVLRNQTRGPLSIERKIRELLQKEQATRASKNGSESTFVPCSSLVAVRVPPTEFSGVIFTKNPLNGMSETIIELVEEQNSSDEVEFQQLIFRNGRFADDGDKNFHGNLEILNRIVAEAAKIETIFRKPVFLEWGYADEKIFWLRVKPLGNLRGLSVYSSKIAREMLPGIILPLVWSVNTPLVSSSWKRLITQLIGENNIDIAKMTRQFHYRAYFNMAIFGDFFDLFGMPRETLEIMMLGEAHKGTRPKMKFSMKVLRYLPKIVFLALRNVNITGRIIRFLQTHKETIESLNVDISNLGEKETLKAINKIIELNEECAYNVIVARLIRSFHHTIMRSFLKRRGITTKIEFNTEDLKDVEPKYSLSTLKEAYCALSPRLKEDLETGNGMPQEPKFGAFSRKYEAFVRRFGHLSDSTVDMSKPQWREKPQLIIDLIKNYQEVSRFKEQNDLDFPASFSGLMMRRFYRNFIEYEKHSLRLGFLYTYGYSLFRNYFLHLGSIFKSKGYIPEASDIFYITLTEIQRIISSNSIQHDYSSAIEKRKDEIARCSDMILPEVIFGETPPPPIRKGAVSMCLKGLASSQGYYEGLARVVTTVADFNKILKGDVLVIPYSDASWTPLFAKAGAVVSESGGLLSHCSIIAREYGIPAVVAVNGATRILENTHLVVDGYTGEVLVTQEKHA